MSFILWKHFKVWGPKFTCPLKSYKWLLICGHQTRAWLKDEPDLNFSLRKKHLPPACGCKSTKGKNFWLFPAVAAVFIKANKHTHPTTSINICINTSNFKITLQTAPGLRSLWDCIACYIYYLKKLMSVNTGLNLQFKLEVSFKLLQLNWPNFYSLIDSVISRSPQSAFFYVAVKLVNDKLIGWAKTSDIRSLKRAVDFFPYLMGFLV